MKLLLQQAPPAFIIINRATAMPYNERMYRLAIVHNIFIALLSICRNSSG